VKWNKTKSTFAILTLQAMALVFPILQAATIIDLNSLDSNIQSVAIQDEILQEYLCYLVKHWLLNTSGLLLKNGTFIWHQKMISTCVLQYHYDHILTRHFKQNKTLELIYIWLSLCMDIKIFCNSCITCMRSKS